MSSVYVALCNMTVPRVAINHAYWTPGPWMTSGCHLDVIWPASSSFFVL